MARIIVTHGINTEGGGVYELGKMLEDKGFEVVFADYEIRHFWSYWNRKKMVGDGRQLAQTMRDGDYFIGHSNAGIVWQQSIEAGAKWGKCVLLGAACTSDKFHYSADSLDEAIVYYNSYDSALQLGSKLPWHPFGKMGRRGFAWNASKEKPEPKDHDGLDRRFHNKPVPSKKWFNIDHSHYFDKDHIGNIANEIAIFLSLIHI